MDWKEVKGAIGTFAPAIAATLGSPLAGVAIKALTDVFGLSEGGSSQDTKESLVAALSGATADQLLALKKADQEHLAKMQELGFKNVEELERLAASDRDSARKREIEVRDKTPRNLAYAITIGFFSVLGALMFGEIPTGSKEVLYIMLGTLGTAWSGVIAYYYGSTSNSAEKTRLLAQSVPADKSNH